MPRLNDKQALYARLYVENGLDGPRAAKDAGYSTCSAESISSHLKRKPQVQADQRRRKALAPAQPDVVAEVLDAGPEAVEQSLPGAPDVADGASSGPAKPISMAQKEGM